MKNFPIKFSATLLSIMSTACFATSYTGSGAVEYLKSHQETIFRDHFTVSGLTSAGSCTTSGGRVVVVLKKISEDPNSEKHFSMLLSSRVTGASVTVTVDDTDKSGAYCNLQYLSY